MLKLPAVKYWFMYEEVVENGTEVSKEEVMEEWISAEYKKVEKSLPSDWRVASVASKEKMLMNVWNRQPLDVFWDHEPIRWFKKELTEKELRSLLVITGPSDEGGWKDVSSPDGTAETVAEKVAEDDFSSEFVDDDYIKDSATKITESPICVIKDPRKPPVIFDGNHRVVSEIYHLNHGEAYEPMEMYIGIRLGVRNSEIENMKN